jgi:hypothetical protein
MAEKHKQHARAAGRGMENDQSLIVRSNIYTPERMSLVCCDDECAYEGRDQKLRKERSASMTKYQAMVTEPDQSADFKLHHGTDGPR